MPKVKTHSLSGYHVKLFAGILVALILAVGILTFFNYSYTKNEQSKHMLDLVQQFGHQTATILESRFEQMESTSDTVRYRLQMLLETSGHSVMQTQMEVNTINEIKNICNSFNFLNISAWMPSSLLSSQQGLFFFDNSLPGGRTSDPEIMNAPMGKLCWTSYHNYSYPLVLFYDNHPFNLLTCFMHINTLKGETFYFFIDIDENEFSKYLDPTEIKSGTYIPPISQFIVDQDGVIISHVDKEKLYTQIDSKLIENIRDGQLLTMDGTVYFSYSLSQTGWRLLVSVPQNFIYDRAKANYLGLIPAVAVTIAVSFGMSLLISKKLTQKLKRMSRVLSDIQPRLSLTSTTPEIIHQRLPVAEKSFSRDELDEFAAAFNYLVDSLNNQLQTIINNSLMQERLRYKLLRAKINPHFLYNILDSIKICNSLGRVEDANRILEKLSDFYRLILRKNDLDMITIREEMEIVSLYLEMETISHEGTFSWTVEMDPDIDLFIIPRFVLQPLVENCVVHGMPGDEKHMNISISIHYTDEAIAIQINDDGLGMDAETLSKLQTVLHTGETQLNSTAFYGLNNVAARLRPYVADPDAPIHYESEKGKGTKVMVMLQQMLPDEKKEVYDVSDTYSGRQFDISERDAGEY